ncbi:hypothetical protein VTN00DRAFT_2159 [Thermoascus crustaceus]|uniref:uncharacterized protein n=1 Tax=Thermoascus crustaceus TaxID=5088 RepID=UPI003744B128
MSRDANTRAWASLARAWRGLGVFQKFQTAEKPRMAMPLAAGLASSRRREPLLRQGGCSTLSAVSPGGTADWPLRSHVLRGL